MEENYPTGDDNNHFRGRRLTIVDGDVDDDDLAVVPRRLPLVLEEGGGGGAQHQRKKKKAKQHRRRHVPVGPAGVWFQQQQQHNDCGDDNNGLGTTKVRANNGGRQRRRDGSSTRAGRRGDENALDDKDNDDNEAEEEEEEADHDFSHLLSKHRRNNDDDDGAAGLSLSFCSNAWMCMQCELGVVIPSLPSYLPVQERYRILRRYVPDGYMLLPEIDNDGSTGGAEWKTRRKLLVVVQTIQSLTDNLWTVTLTDETGASALAWVQPRLVREEQQRQNSCHLRPGYVWLLDKGTTTSLVVLDSASARMLFPSSHAEQQHRRDRPSAAGDVQIRRMLLVSQENILRVWTPAQSKDVSDRDYVRWQEKRQTMTAEAMEHASFRPRHRPPPPPSRRPEARSTTTTSSSSLNATQQPSSASTHSATGNYALHQDGGNTVRGTTHGASSLGPRASQPETMVSAQQQQQPSQQSRIPAQGQQSTAIRQPPPALANPLLQSPRLRESSVDQTAAAANDGKTPLGRSDGQSSFGQFASSAATDRRSSTTSHLRGSAPSTVNSNDTTIIVDLNSSTASYQFSQFASPTINGQSVEGSVEQRESGVSNLSFPNIDRVSPKPTEAPLASTVNASSPTNGMGESVLTPPPESSNAPESGSHELSQHQQKKKSNKKKRRSRSPKPSSSKKKSPAPSNILWTTNDSSIMGMFDDDDDDDVADDKAAAATTVAGEATRTTGNARPPPHVEQKEATEAEISVATDKATTKTSLFDAGAFSNTGMDIDDLFDDDDDEDGDDD